MLTLVVCGTYRALSTVPGLDKYFMVASACFKFTVLSILYTRKVRLRDMK